MRKRDKPHKSYGQFLLCLSGMLFFVNSCGVVGSPIPPENIGIEAKIRAQKKAQERQTRNDEKPTIPLGEESVPLPPLQPVTSQ